MKTTQKKRIDLFRKKLFESDLSSDIEKRLNRDYDFLLIYDSNEELIDLMNETIYEFSDLKKDWDEYLKISKHPNIWDFFFDGHYGYIDEYEKCEDCQSIFMRSDMDYSYHKEGICIELEGEYKCLCSNCIKDYKDIYLESLENNHRKWCNMFTVEECEEAGYEQVTIKIEHGLYGRTASPEKILKTWLELYPNDKFIFVRTDENPFACEFILMKKIKNEEV